MANLYSVEIQGRFNASQLQQALDNAARNQALTIKVSADAVRNAANSLSQSASASISGLTVDINKLRQASSQIDVLKNSSGEIYGYTFKINEELGKVRTVQARINQDTQEWVLHSEKVATNIAKQKAAQKALSDDEQAALAKQEAARTKEIELLDRKLGKLKEGVRLQQGYTNADVLQAAGLPSNATISASGAFTPTASGGTWQRYIVSIEEAANKFQNYAVSINTSTGEMRKLDTGITTTNKALTAQGETLDRLFVKVIKWAALTTLVYLPIRAFKEALATLKEVDTQLVSIQKVTDYNSNQIKELTNRVYELASAYGKTADELLEVSVAFARAGFQNNLAEMTELAALVENVGYVTGDEASKFLIAANAAWQLEGNYESLMKIIDGMDNVTNHAANSFSDLSEGITVAGSVFANAGESAQTFTAMLGTVVATTQRSGTEVARGLRTIAMNIRQIKGELDDGEIIDESSISDAAKALNSVGVSVSKNGDLRKVSDVLSDLAEKWDTLTSAEQSYLASNLAGKRQANTLVALMSNYSEYQRELQLYADGAGTALKENEIYLDSWEAKTKILKATWIDFVSSIVETDMVKGALDAIIGLVEILNNKFVQTAVQVGVVAKTLDAVSKYLLATNVSQSLGITALLGGSTAPILAVVAAIYAVSKAYDYLNVTIDEQKEKVESLRLEYEKLYGEGSELAELQEREADTLTTKEKAQLEHLEKKAALQQEIIDKEQAIADAMVRDELSDNSISTNVDSVSDDYSTHIAKVIEQEQLMAETLSRVRTEELKGIGTRKEHSGALADLITEYSDIADVLERNKDNLTEQESLWLSMYHALLTAYDGLKIVEEQEETEATVTNELSNKVDSAIESFTDWEKSLSIVRQAQQELNEQGYISVDTFNELAKSYPAIIENSTALANGYKVEESALGNLISSEKENANLQQLTLRNAAISYINSMSNIALQTNATTEAILNQIDALLDQREVMLSMGSSSDIYSAWSRDSVVKNLQGIRSSLSKSADYASLIGKASSSSSDNAVLDSITDYYDIISHRIWLAQQRMNSFEEDSDAYNKELKKQAEYYVSLKKWAADKASELRKQGYAEESEEIKKLQQIWWESENWILDQRKNIISQAQSLISDYLSDEKDELDAQTEKLDARITKYKALIDLEEAYYDISSNIKSEQSDISKQLKTAKEAYQYLDEATRKMLFNDDDYATLSSKLTEIQAEAAEIYEKYQKEINSLTTDNIYLAEQLTTEFENQYELKQKEYEIAKAELGLAKAQTKLENVQANRNTMMLVDGQFQWVADPKAIEEALEDYADAEDKYNDAVADAAHTRKVNELEASKQEIATNKSRLQSEYEAMADMLEDMKDNLSDSLTSSGDTLYECIMNIADDISEDAAPELKKQLVALAQVISDITNVKVTASSSTKSITGSSGQTITYTENSSGKSGAISGVNTNDSSYYRVTSTYGMNFLNGTGYAYEKMADGSVWERDSNGNVTITKDGKTYSESAGQIRTYAGGIENGAVTQNGLAMLHGTPSSPEYVLNSKQAYTLLKNLSTATLDANTVRNALGANGKYSTTVGGTSNTDDHSIIVNGMTVTGQNAESLAKAMRAVLPLHA